MSSTINQTDIQNVYNQIMQCIKSQTVNINQMIDIIIKIIGFAEELTTYNTSQKYDLVIDVIKQVVATENNGLPPIVNNILTLLVNNEPMLVGLINALISAAKGLIPELKKEEQNCFNCCKSWF